MFSEDYRFTERARYVPTREDHGVTATALCHSTEDRDERDGPRTGTDRASTVSRRSPTLVEDYPPLAKPPAVS